VRSSSSPHVFVDGLDSLTLTDDDDHHLRRVLRLRSDEEVVAADGRGGWRPCRLTAAGLEPAGDVGRDPAPAPLITIGFALTKADKPEWAVQKLTEAGVDIIRPFVAERSVVRWDEDRAARQHQRLGRVAREAAMQSRRTWLPEVAAPAAFAAVLATAGPAAALAHPGGASPTLERPTVLVGPEGGFSPAELEIGLPRVGLGPTVLRAETAAVAAGLALAWLRAGVVRPI
jgi:16S rRNA (uracil1498-N3)-methyltransferase